MSGTTTGGKAAAATNVERYGKDFYSRIGTKGGAASHTGGFYGDPALAKRAGRLGGIKSRRGPKKDVTNTIYFRPSNTAASVRFIPPPKSSLLTTIRRKLHV